MNRKPSFLKSIKRAGGALVLVMLMFWAVSFSSPVPLSAAPFCACCAEPGAWNLETHEIRDSETRELNRLTFGVANFYTTDAAPDDVSGVSFADDDPHELVISIVREKRNWRLVFKTLKSEKGSLILTMPGTATFFDADISTKEGPRLDNKDNSGLYKEIRVEGAVRGTGMFAKGMAPKTKYRLVLQGGGNWCLNAEDFYRWNLRVSGPRAGYTIYGYFARPSQGIDR